MQEAFHRLAPFAHAFLLIGALLGAIKRLFCHWRLHPVSRSLITMPFDIRRNFSEELTSVGHGGVTFHTAFAKKIVVLRIRVPRP